MVRYYVQQRIVEQGVRLLNKACSDGNPPLTQCDWQVGEFSGYRSYRFPAHHASHTGREKVACG